MRDTLFLLLFQISSQPKNRFELVPSPISEIQQISFTHDWDTEERLLAGENLFENVEAAIDFTLLYCKRWNKTEDFVGGTVKE
jgi:hypothetical protein